MRRMMISVVMAVSLNATAQDSSHKENPEINPLTFGGFIEIYYCYDFNQPLDNNRPAFVYSHNRHNEFNLNLGYLKGSYQADRIRGNIALAAGTYMNANYAAEPGVLKNVYEANAGFKINKKNLWLDAGIFSSHIGFESAHSPSCWTLTRGLAADNSPYYEAGAKLTYTTTNNKWTLSVLALNGWQRIKRVDGNSLMSFGTQATFKPTGKVTLNYSSFIGTDKADSVRQMRYFHNIYGIFQLSDRFGLTAGFDIGTEEKPITSSGMNTWFTPVLVAKYSIGNKWSVTAKGEYYKDKNGVIIATGTPNGFNTTGLSLNVDYSPANNAILRVEGRAWKSKDDIFSKGHTMNNEDFFMTMSLALTF